MENISFADLDLTKKVEVFLDAIPKVLSHEHTAISLQPLPQAIAVELRSSTGPLEADYKAYFTTFPKELEFISTIDEYVRLGQEHIRMLYCYRSVSQAIPEISIEITDEMTSEEKSELASKRTEINQKILDVLRPEMRKLQELLTYIIDAIDCFYSCVSYVCYKDQHKEMIPEGFYLSLIQLLDIFIKLDSLKDYKNSLRKDFARYKRAIGNHPSIELMEEISKLQTFLAGQDTRKSQNYIIQTLREEIKRINDHEHLLLECLDLTLTCLDDINYVLPEEKFCYLRVIPYLLLLIDGELDDNKSSNIFKNGKIKISNIQKLLKKNPIVPLYADMTLNLEVVLQRCPHYDKTTAASWGAEPIEHKVIESYDLRSYWETVRQSYSQYLIKYSTAVNRYTKYPFQKNIDEVSIEVANDVYQLILEGLQKLSRWIMIIKQSLAWKYSHPLSKEKILNNSSNNNTDNDVLVTSLLERDGIDYALALKYNLSKEEKSILIDFIFMIKSLSSHLLKQEALFAPYIRFHIHHSIQQLVQGDLTPLLHRLDKRNKPILPTILKLRSLAADWINGMEPGNDYKEYSRKQGAVQALSHPPRVVGPAITQLYILRTQVASLCESKSEVRRKESIFGKADLERTDVEIFDRFYQDSFYFPYLLNYCQHIREISDLSELWYREFYLELTKCIQFPIDMSLPWMLIEHVLTTEEEQGQGGSVNTKKNQQLFLENVFYLFDIYNDAANRSLYQLHSQFLYDEIEAETNLVIDQFYYLLSDEMYNYYKNMSSLIILDKSYQLKYDEMKQQKQQQQTSVLMTSRYHHILTQKTIQLLGRSINLSMIFTHNITSKFHRDIDIAIKRFESYDIRGIIELKQLLYIIKMTHELLSNYLLLDSFDHMLQEIDECWSTTAYRGRISLHILTSLARDIFPNFSYNQYTQRFIPSPIPVRPWEYNKAPKQTVIQQCYGNNSNYKAYESQGRLVRGFFGSVHIQALLSLESILTDRLSHSNNNLSSNNSSFQSNAKNGHYGITQLTMILDQIVKNLYDKILDINEYLNALKDSIPPCKPPQAIFKSIGAYGYYEGKLKSLLEFDDLKPEVFQIFREIGNTIAFLKDLSNALELQDGLNAHFISSLFPTSLSTLLPVPPPPTTAAAPTTGRESLASVSETMSTASSSDNIAEHSPVMKIVQHLQKTLLTNIGTNASLTPQGQALVKNPLTLQYLPLNIDRQLQYYALQYNIQSNAVPPNNKNASASSSTLKNGKNLMKWLLIQLEEFFYQQNFTTEWSTFSEENINEILLLNSATNSKSLSINNNMKRENFVIEIENNSSFSKMWSALCFLFCINESDNNNNNDNNDNDTASEVNSRADTMTTNGNGNENKELTNYAEFGHGFLIAGALFLHLLGQRSLFELIDFTNLVVRMVDYEGAMGENVLADSAAKAGLDASLVREYKSFIIEARKVLQMNYEWLSYFSSIYTIRPSYSKYATNRNTFHPPAPPTLNF